MNAFDVQPWNINAGGSITASYTVTDNQGLDRVELWRSPDESGTPGTWTEVDRVENISGTQASSNPNPDTDPNLYHFLIDTPDEVRNYLYGIHVVGTDGNCTTKENKDCRSEIPNGGPDPGPILVTVSSAPGDGLVAYWSFDNCDGTDDSGNGNTGTVYGSPECGDGIIGKALKFTGRDFMGSNGDHVLIPSIDFASMGSFSISLWVNEEGFSHGHGESYIFFGEGGLTEQYDGYVTIAHWTDYLRYSVGNSHSYNPRVDPIQVLYDMNDRNKYVLYSLVYENGIMKAYKNTNLLGSRNHEVKVYTNKAAIARHWWWGNQASTRFTGIIDDVRIYNYALNESEIENLYDQGSGQLPTTINRVSVGPNGIEANGGSGWNFISANGRFVVFYSVAKNLVPGGSGGGDHVFIHDRFSGITEQADIASDGSEANGNSNGGWVSPDGRFVGFWSGGDNLAPGDTKRDADVFVRDRFTGTTERVSVASDGVQGNGWSGNPWISEDGQFLVFNSIASNLVPDDTNDSVDIFVHNRLTGTTERVPKREDF